MKKKGPQRSQSRRARPGSSRYGLGKTTCCKLTEVRKTSRLMVVQTGSVKVLEGPPPNPTGPLDPKTGRGGGLDAGVLGGAEGVRAGTAEGTGGTDDGVMGMEARGGLEGRAAGTEDDVADEEVKLKCSRLSISSMSDCEVAWFRGTVSLCGDMLDDMAALFALQILWERSSHYAHVLKDDLAN